MATRGFRLGIIPGLQGDQNFWFRWKPAGDPGTTRAGNARNITVDHLGLPESDGNGRSAGDEAANLVVFVMIPGLGATGEHGMADACNGVAQWVRCFRNTEHTGQDTIDSRHNAEARVRHVLGWAERSLKTTF